MSETILFITLGARDIRLITNVKDVELIPIEDQWTLKNNREGAKFLLENFNEWKNIIEYPIIKPAIDWTIKNYNSIDKLFFIATDQSSVPDVEKLFINSDTIETARLFQKIFRKDYLTGNLKQMKIITISSGVTYYDTMYDFFEDKFKTVFKFGKKSNIILYAQSGIDAINTTLLLKCLENYPQTIQLNKPQNTKYAFELEFPKKFLKSLTAHKIKHNLNNYNYAAIAQISDNEIITEIAGYAFSRLSLDMDAAREHLQRLLQKNSSNRIFYLKQLEQLNEMESNFEKKQKDIYLKVKIKLCQKAYAEFLMILFSLAENLLKPRVEQLTNSKFSFNKKGNHKEWKSMLEANKQLKDYLDNQLHNGKKLNINEPNRAAYKAIIDYYYSGNDLDEINKINNNIEILTGLRNSVVHNLAKVNKGDINRMLQKGNTNLDNFIVSTDNFFQVTGMGIYDEINSKIEQLL